MKLISKKPDFLPKILLSKLVSNLKGLTTYVSSVNILTLPSKITNPGTRININGLISKNIKILDFDEFLKIEGPLFNISSFSLENETPPLKFKRN